MQIYNISAKGNTKCLIAYQITPKIPVMPSLSRHLSDGIFNCGFNRFYKSVIFLYTLFLIGFI